MKLAPELYRDLIGTPFAHGGRGPDAYDCVGLAAEVQRRRGFRLPEYLSDVAELHRQVARGGVFHDAHRVLQPDGGVVVLLRTLGGPARHLGVMVDAVHMLHCSEPSRAVVLEPLPRSRWARRVLGYYRLDEEMRA